MDSFAGKLAVVTGGGSGIGRELAVQLATQGCSVAACDRDPQTAAAAAELAQAGAPSGVLVTGHRCDVSQEEPADLSGPELAQARDALVTAGLVSGEASADEVRQAVAERINDFRDKAPVSAAEAAGIILDGVRSGKWRILVGQDARWLDEQVRARPEAAYDYAEFFSPRPGADAPAP